MYRQSVFLSKNKEVEIGRNNFTSMPSLHIYADKPDRNSELENISPNTMSEGFFDAQREYAKEINQNCEKFDDVIKRSRTIIFRTKTVFPFDLFPSDLLIDLTKITVVSRRFFLTGYTQSIHVKDIMDVIVSSGPFFSSLTILDLGYLQRNKLYVKYLKKADALHARQIIEGLIAASKAGVDLTKIPRRDLLPRLPELLRSQVTPMP